MKKVLIISSDVLDENMAGMGMRYWELAHALAHTCQVTLAIPNQTQLNSASVNLVSFDWEHGDLTDVARMADVIIIQGFVLHFHPYLKTLGIPLAVDLYVPFILENLVWHDSDDWSTWIPAYEEYLRVQLELLRAGDFFFCASERQRDYWLGLLHAQKRINPHTYRDDPALRKLIDVVPFGLPSESPPPHRPVVKGIHKGIPKDCRLIIWNGGLWDWLDPLTLIRAVAELAQRHPDLRLFFMGTHHPNSVVTGMAMPERAIQLSQELGLFDRIIFFGSWIPYQERTNYLQEADLGVVSSLDHIETRFSFRTRVLDCIWTRLPLVLTSGDVLADMVVEAQVGMSVPPGEVPSMVNAIETMIYAGDTKIPQKSWSHLRETLCWENVVIPLQTYCQNPYFAADKGKYLTEVERISRDKDAFHKKVIQEKDAFLEKVILEKNAFLEQVIQEKNAFLEQVIQEKDANFERVAQEKDAVIERVTRENASLDQVMRDKETLFTNVVNQKEAAYNALAGDYNRLRSKFPLRIYYFICSKFNKK